MAETPTPSPDSSRAPRPPPPSLASRYFFLFLIGLFVGAMAVVMVLRAVEGRKTWEDRFPGAVMQVMTAHMSQLKQSVASNRCAASDVLPHVQALRVLANDIEPAFPGLKDDKRFLQHASNMRATLDKVLSTPPLACAGVESALQEINESCGACHQDFRG